MNGNTLKSLRNKKRIENPQIWREEKQTLKSLRMWLKSLRTFLEEIDWRTWEIDCEIDFRVMKEGKWLQEQSITDTRENLNENRDMKFSKLKNKMKTLKYYPTETCLNISHGFGTNLFFFKEIRAKFVGKNLVSTCHKHFTRFWDENFTPL